MIAVLVGNSLSATMNAARIAAASAEAPGTDGGFDAKGRYGPSRTALTASNIANCAMVVRTCVRNAFSPTEAPSDVNRLPQSSSNADPVSAGTDDACPLIWPLGPNVRTNRIPTITNAAKLQCLSFMTAPFQNPFSQFLSTAREDWVQSGLENFLPRSKIRTFRTPPDNASLSKRLNASDETKPIPAMMSLPDAEFIRNFSGTCL